MKTTELFVEQMIIGLLILLATYFFYFPYTHSLPEIKWGSGAILLITAYLSGVVWDRVADTLLDDFDQLLRLSLSHKPFLTNPNEDCFTEDLYFNKCLEHGGTIGSYIFYLRSHIRLLRAILTLLPALTITFLVQRLILGPEKWKYIAVLLFIYGLVFLLKLLLHNSTRRPPLTKVKYSDKMNRHFETHARSKKAGQEEEVKTIIFSDLVSDPVVWGYLALLLTGGVLISHSAGVFETGVMAIGFSLTLVSFWAWYRISKTFKNFVRVFYFNRDKNKQS